MSHEIDTKIRIFKEIDIKIQNQLMKLQVQKEIIHLLKENNGEIEEKKVCALLGIIPYDIPWGYNIGWARCLQPNQTYHLLLSSEQYNEQ